MLAAGDGFDHWSAAMEVRQFIRPDVTVSAIVHLSLVAFVVIYSEVRPFRPVAEKAVPVEIVVADDAKKSDKKSDEKPDPLPTPLRSPDLSELTKPASPTTSPAPQPAASPPPQQATRATRGEGLSQQALTQQVLSQRVLAQPQPQTSPPAPAAPGYAPPQPDLSIKYHVMLGLPDDLPPPAASGDTRGEGGDTTPASDNLASNLVEPLRQHLKTCSKLPAALSPSDNVAVKLRVQMTPDGRLAAEPILLEGSASVKGVELMRGAVAALAACQPYAMLPANRYGEWKVLDLSFTPRDFNS